MTRISLHRRRWRARPGSICCCCAADSGARPNAMTTADGAAMTLRRVAACRRHRPCPQRGRSHRRQRRFAAAAGLSRALRHRRRRRPQHGRHRTAIARDAARGRCDRALARAAGAGSCRWLDRQAVGDELRRVSTSSACRSHQPICCSPMPTSATTPAHSRRSSRRAERDGLVLTSLMAKLRCESFAERALIPAFIFFFRMLYPFAWVNRPGRADRGGGGRLHAGAARGAARGGRDRGRSR